MIRRRLLSGSPWEQRFGYARAVRAGSFVAISGTVASDAEGRPAAGDPYGQARAIFVSIASVLRQAGSALEDVVRLRVHYADAGVADGFARALAEAFPRGAPALTTVRVAGLVSPEFLLEIEADAVIPDDRDPGRDPGDPAGEDAD